ncbi:TPA: hypothetical protein N0F65_004639 [Lagenidium giganteum]|uniref:Uncharacterized protein n=1 Tax=Lagenidium giganteum TaxID=4803 RepID=A0AAV2ZCT1_9STRA|nr:TPA: hypothetical protein N0F65_004639 [Lagenidium giganteum]
MSQRLSSSLG